MMKTKSLQNYDSTVGVEAYDIDWSCKEELLELGRLCASQCIVFVDEHVPTETLYNTMMEWGESSRAFIHNAVISKKLQGRHWREILLNLGFINRDIDEKFKGAVSMVSYKRDEKNRPKGIFQNGKLNWHSDQCAFDDGQRIIGLCSVSDTENSQTQFLCTHDAFESLSSDMQSMIKELVVKHKWIDNSLAPGLNHSQTLLIHYNSVPIDGMETKLYRETCTGLPGMKLPVNSFGGFVGMSMEESNRIMDEINKSVYKEEYIYTQNWRDGQLVFMDQEITLHRRPTNVEDGNKRTMVRVISYLNKLFDNEQSRILDEIRYNGAYYDQTEFLSLVDEDRKRRFLLEETSEY